MELKVNQELLSHIKAMMVFNSVTEVIPITELSGTDPKQMVYLILWCEESKKHKLSKMQYAKLPAAEAMVYVNLGIPEYRGEGKELDKLGISYEELKRLNIN